MAWTNEQLSAIEKSGTNIIVSAGAGSGKTAVLTERVIRKVKSGIHINELLILTFTKAAAAEMKERIRSSLKDNNLIEELKLIDSAYITTFDSFSLSILKKYHYILNISSSIKVAPEPLVTMAKRNILDDVFESLYDSGDESFLRFISDFCVRDDNTIKKYIMNIANKLEMKADLNDYLNSYIDTYYNDEYIDSKILEFEKLILNKVNELNNKLDELSHYCDNSYYEKVLDSITPLLNSTSIEELLTYPNIKLPATPRGSADELKTAKEDLNSVLKEIYVLLDYGNKDTIKDNLLKTKIVIEVIINILKRYFELLTKYKMDNELYEFNDIALLAIKILKENKDICDEVKYSLKEILVDEYQDTNDLQEEFISMIANDNVYMVGDIKQSIYRFRNANPYIFKNKYDNYSKENNGIKIDLLKNFRSRDIVLDNINDIFDLVMDDNIGGAEYIKSHRMVFGNTTYINEGKTNQDYNLEVLEYELDKKSEYTKEEVEIFAIARDIKKKVKDKFQVFDKSKKVLKDVSYSDFVILMDRTTSFELYKKIFEYLEIPLTLYKDETLNTSDDIYIFKNIINLLIKINKKEYDTSFKYSFTSIARSYLFTMSDNEILNFFVNNNFKDSKIFKLLQSIDINSLTIYEVIEKIIDITNMYEKLITVGDIDNSLIRIQKILEMASDLEGYGYDIYRFYEYFETLIDDGYEIKYSIGTDNTDSVKIMTIHKSKGLEYHICYFSGLYKSFNISDMKEAFTYSNKYGIITPYFLDGINTTIYKELLKDNYMNEEISEKIRLFYVAVTRAKEKMIMLLPHMEDKYCSKEDNGVISNSIRSKYKSLADILYSIKFYISKYYKEISIDDLELTKDYKYIKEKELDFNNYNNSIIVDEINIESNSLDSQSFSKKTYDLVSKENKENMLFGTKVHEILEHVDFKNYQSISDKYIDKKIRKLLDSDIMKNIKDSKIYKEYEFIYNKDNIIYHGIIDLMIEYIDHIDIIDYKLKNVDSDEYIKQLKGYKEFIENKIKKNVNLYLYSILDEEIKEIN